MFSNYAKNQCAIIIFTQNYTILQSTNLAIDPSSFFHSFHIYLSKKSILQSKKVIFIIQ